MAQVVVYGHRSTLTARREALSEAIHGAVMAALAYPPEKRFHRFIGLDDADFIHPTDRGADYTIIEISMFEGRSEEAKRALIRELFTRIEAEAGISPHSVGSRCTSHRRSTGGSAAPTAPTWPWATASRSDSAGDREHVPPW